MNKPVSFPIAKLVRLKGFDEPCSSFYRDGELSEVKSLVTNKKLVTNSQFMTSRYFTAPRISDVVMWLYEKYGIWIYADSHEFGKWCYNYKFNRPHELNPRITENGKFSLEDYNSPTEAYERGIEYTLNNLI